MNVKVKWGSRPPSCSMTSRVTWWTGSPFYIMNVKVNGKVKVKVTINLVTVRWTSRSPSYLLSRQDTPRKIQNLPYCAQKMIQMTNTLNRNTVKELFNALIDFV